MAALLLCLLFARHGDLLAEGTPAPAIDARGQDGRAFGGELDGRVTVVDFFATWCPHCRDSLAGHDRLMEAFGDRVRLLIIDVDEEPSLVRAFFARRRLPTGAELVFDRASLTSRAWKVTGFPTMYLLDRGGVVRYATSGYAYSQIVTLSKLIPSLEHERPGGRAGKRARGASANTTTSSTEDAHARALGVEVLH